MIRLAAWANFNLLRMNGVGLIEKQEFYDLCDRYGIMLFQEFPNAGARLPESDTALAIATLETKEILPGTDQSSQYRPLWWRQRMVSRREIQPANGPTPGDL